VSYGKSSLLASWFIVGLLLLFSSRIAEDSADAPIHFNRAASRLGVFFGVLLGFAPLLRLIWLQEVAADKTATLKVQVPDADKSKRFHTNPRILYLMNQIPRGRILDRNEQVLATTEKGERTYPEGRAFAHLVGYADPAIGGPVGMEADLAPQLRGFDDWQGLVGLWRRKDLPGFKLPEGEDVHLTLDAAWQAKAHEALVRGMERSGKPTRRGAVVVLDAQTGAVLVAVTHPTYNPNQLTPSAMKALDKSREKPFLDRTRNGYYPPGSTFKIVTATSLLAHEKADFTVTCNKTERNLTWREDGQTFARRRVTDDETDRPHGRTDLAKAVSESCNVYFARAAVSLGPDNLHETATQFGFAKLPARETVLRDLPDIGYGQGAMLATPLEMANVAQTVASGGKRMAPFYLLTDSPQEVSRPLTEAQASQLAGMMREVVASGTAAGKFNGLPFTVAGKTGTAQNDRYDRSSHSWFIGFAPAQNPRYAFAVLVENAGYGGRVAAPIAREVLANAPKTP
jgi:peptidoglycan glycosyltransferase